MVQRGVIRGVARRGSRRKGLEGVILDTKPSGFGFIPLEDWKNIENGIIKDIKDVKKSLKNVREVY
jgi:hypothetical protein